MKPSVEVASKIADALEVSLDYLFSKMNVEIDAKTLQRLQDIQSLNGQDKGPYLQAAPCLPARSENKKAYASQ